MAPSDKIGISQSLLFTPSKKKSSRMPSSEAMEDKSSFVVTGLDENGKMVFYKQNSHPKTEKELGRSKPPSGYLVGSYEANQDSYHISSASNSKTLARSLLQSELSVNNDS